MRKTSSAATAAKMNGRNRLRMKYVMMASTSPMTTATIMPLVVPA